jgi:radical SAM superfamily enzyme YgiQ (UPF0313 family)
MDMLTATNNATTNEPFRARNRRRILCVFPHYAHSFGTFEHAHKMLSVQAFLPPQGILLITSYLPDEWEVRFVDENKRLTKDRDFKWADVVFVTGMHVQAGSIHRITERAHQFGKLTAGGGPSVSGCPDWYPDIDMLHIGEIGDATDKLIARIDADISRPEAQERYTTVERLALTDFPTPAYDQLNLNDYFLASVQYSSGCPFRCEFCDIPSLYGRNPRLKTPQQVTRELDAMLAQGNPGCVYFVDDNFIGNPKATVPLLEELIRWQKERGYPVQFACEASLNVTRKADILELMREAYFTTVFCGIETPEDAGLKGMGKVQNLRKPVLESVKMVNDYGMEVVSGIIVGLDTDTPNTYPNINNFIDASHIPMLTINVIQALPRTQLWDRLTREGRLIEDPGERESNVDFLLPYETVLEGWRTCIEHAYSPEAIYRRFDWQMEHTYPNRKPLPASKARVNAHNIAHGFKILAQVMWQVGVLSGHRREFWRRALPALKEGRIEDVIHVGAVSYHMIRFGKECVDGTAEKSFYSPTGRQATTAESA